MNGEGVFTKRGRCFPYWAEFKICSDKVKYPEDDCIHHVLDYMECLHHTKEKARMIKIIGEIRRKKGELLKEAEMTATGGYPEPRQGE